MQNTAVRVSVVSAAARLQLCEPLAQALKTSNLAFNARELPFDERVHVVQIGIVPRVERAQARHVFERQIKFSTVPYEQKALKVCLGVDAIPVGLTSRRRQQSLGFIKANSFLIDAGPSGQFSDAHDFIISRVTTQCIIHEGGLTL